MKNLDGVKRLIVQLVESKIGVFDGYEWEADYNLNWDSEFSERLDAAFYDVGKAAVALRDKDDVTLIAAVLGSRTDFLDLSNFFRDIYEDLDALATDISWPDIPEDFVYEGDVNK